MASVGLLPGGVTTKFQPCQDVIPEVRLHTLANPRSNRAIQHLLDHLNAAELTYPGTNVRLTYTLATPPPNAATVPS